MTGQSHASRSRMPLRDDESGVFVVVEAVLVAVIVLTAILFYTSVQRPQRSGEQGSADLGQVAADLLAILRRHDVDDPDDPDDLVLRDWVTRIMAGDDAIASDVQVFLDEIVPSGARYVLRLNNGHGMVDLVPSTQVGTPAGAQAAETPLFPLWAANKDPAIADGVTTLGSPVVTSASSTFSAADVGKMVSSDAFPACTRIVAVAPPNAITLSEDAAADATGVGFTVAQQWRTAADAETATGSTTLLSATAAFSGADVGRMVSGDGIPPCSTIVSVASTTEATLSSAATLTATNVIVWIEPPVAAPGDQVSAGQLYKLTQNAQVKCIRAPVPSIAGTEGSAFAPGAETVPDAATTSGSVVLTSSSANWLATDVGRPLSGAGIPDGATIATRASATQVTMSAAATATATGTVVTVGNTWLSLWQGSQTAGAERVPYGVPYGVWVGYPNADCSGTAVHGRVALPGAATPDDYPMYGLQLVVWYGA